MPGNTDPIRHLMKVSGCGSEGDAGFWLECGCGWDRKFTEDTPLTEVIGAANGHWRTHKPWKWKEK